MCRGLLILLRISTDPAIVYSNAHAIRINCSVIHVVHSESLKDH